LEIRRGARGRVGVAQPISKDDTTSTPTGQRSRLGIGAVASLIGVGFLLVFVLQNNQRVDLDFLAWTFTWPLWLLIVVAAVLGALVWFGLGIVRRHRRRVRRRQNRRT
jgi:uncharacterized integral membrane protein